ncbi:hypothetical protein BpHYR1_016157 [Brachionus plicatilis]|uniref:Uncharacterized protein n=1 Tax=Brachionus plicatilis TaxID=10195 RepID=A0A3M7RP92_BRAPC|nr:hypothetical protein BpHYR1_016157 [Brachionus plicatilis]
MIKIDLEKRVENFFKNILFESLFLGLLTASSIFCGKFIIKATPGFKLPFSLYSVFVAGISVTVEPLFKEFKKSRRSHSTNSIWKGLELPYDSCEKLERISEKFQMKN